MNQLLDSSEKYVIIYSCNDEKFFNEKVVHVQCRKFTNWIKQNKKIGSLYNILGIDFLIRKKIQNILHFLIFILKKKNEKED